MTVELRGDGVSHTLRAGDMGHSSENVGSQPREPEKHGHRREPLGEKSRLRANPCASPSSEACKPQAASQQTCGEQGGPSAGSVGGLWAYKVRGSGKGTGPVQAAPREASPVGQHQAPHTLLDAYYAHFYLVPLRSHSVCIIEEVVSTLFSDVRPREGK